MKPAFSCIALLLASFAAQAAPPAMNSVTSLLPGADARYAGLKNMRMVMPGVLYRGGGTGAKAPLGSAPLEALCKDGFSSAVFVYRSGWQGDRVVDCQAEKGESSLTYVDRAWDHSNDLKAVLAELHSIIVNRGGPMYVHCWYGVHASGFVVTAALRQFCGLSAEEGVAYWNSNTPAKIRYPAVQAKIRAFQPYPEYEISDADRARVCPQL